MNQCRKIGRKNIQTCYFIPQRARRLYSYNIILNAMKEAYDTPTLFGCIHRLDQGELRHRPICTDQVELCLQIIVMILEPSCYESVDHTGRRFPLLCLTAHTLIKGSIQQFLKLCTRIKTRNNGIIVPVHQILQDRPMTYIAETRQERPCIF